MSEQCKRCAERGKTWQGSDPRCAFPEGVFEPDNWNCETANLIRNICCEEQTWTNPGNELYDGVTYTYCDDMKYATIRNRRDRAYDDDNTFLGLIVVWYKSRGNTDQICVIDGTGIRPATIAQCEAIIEEYKEVHP